MYSLEKFEKLINGGWGLKKLQKNKRRPPVYFEPESRNTNLPIICEKTVQKVFMTSWRVTLLIFKFILKGKQQYQQQAWNADMVMYHTNSFCTCTVLQLKNWVAPFGNNYLCVFGVVYETKLSLLFEILLV